MLEIITQGELELLLSGKPTDKSKKAPEWLKVVRALPCLHPNCGVVPAGTAHHVFSAGIALRCDDHLTIPLCINCHVIGKDPVQHMNDEEFLVAMGLNKEDAVRRTYEIIMDRYNNGYLA